MGGCSHVGPSELVAMAEKYLGKYQVAAQAWSGCKFGYGDNVEMPTHRSVYVEIERRGQDWVVTRLDRRPEPYKDGEGGFITVQLNETAALTVSQPPKSI